MSRNGNQFSSFIDLSRAIPGELACTSAVLDGEIVCLDRDGKSQFNELLFRRGEPRFCAFDLLYCEGKDLRFDALHERKRQLKALVSNSGHLLYCDHVEARGEDVFPKASAPLQLSMGVLRERADSEICDCCSHSD